MDGSGEWGGWLFKVLFFFCGCFEEPGFLFFVASGGCLTCFFLEGVFLFFLLFW